MPMTKRTLFAAVAALMLAAPSAADAGDPKAGEKVFKKCKACHTIEQGGKNRLGPNLYGIVGRKGGAVEGFKYSNALKEWGGTWTEENLDKYLEKPRNFIPKNRMAFPGLKKKKQRDDVIAYLKANG